MAEIKGGQQLESVLKNLAKQIGKGGSLRVGFLEGATYPNGTSVATVAAVQEYGAPSRGIPPRPFFRNMIKENAANWPQNLKVAIERTGDTEQALGLLGERIAGQLRESIVSTNSPPLAASTVRAKGFAKPLVDTGQMLGSVDYEISVNGEVSRGLDQPEGLSDSDYADFLAERQANMAASAVEKGSRRG